MDYLSVPISTRLAWFKKEKASTYGICRKEGGRDLIWRLNISHDFGPAFQLGGDTVRWCEDVRGHFREVGEAHKLVNLRHTGWYTDNFQDQITKGIVLQLPGRNHEPIYLAAITDPWNKNTAIVSLDQYGDKEDAARAADSLAEAYAEDAREHDAKDQAEQQIEDAKERIQEIRDEIRDLCAGIRQSTLAPIICEAMRRTIRGLLSEKDRKYRRIEKLQENHWEAVH